MANYTNITASWETGTLTERMISRQFDDAATLVSFAGIPTGDDVSATYHLIVWMATEEGGEPTEQSPIQLSGPEWLISNFYTQFQQSIQFQLCIQLDGTDDYEAHSPIFSGRIGKSLRHDGETSEIDTATMFDPYKEWVQEQAMAAGAVVIDNTLSVNGAAADAKAVGDAIKAGKSFVVQVPGSAAVFSGNLTAGDFAKALAAYTAGSGVYAVKDGEVYQLSAAGSSTMTFTQMYHGTMNFIKQIVITSADTFTVTNTALSSSAADTSYSNTTSGLAATNVQDAIDESAAALSDTNERLDSLGDGVPTEVRQAILTLFQSAAYAETGLTDEVAVIESWAAVVTAIVLNKTSVSINGANTNQLVATTTPAGGMVTWASSDTSVATVSSSGLVTGVGNGSCIITASCGGKKATCAVTVSGFAELTGITAVYTQGGSVYKTDTLDSLKSDLVVTALFSDSTSQTVTDYALSGTLEIGNSTITVSYNGKTTTFTVLVSERMRYSYADGTLEKSLGGFTVITGHPEEEPKFAYDIRTQKVNVRRAFHLNYGEYPLWSFTGTNDGTAVAPTEPYIYPIPIPASATGVSVSITPSTQFVQVELLNYTGDPSYESLSTQAWIAEQRSVTFEAGQYQYLTVMSKYNSAGSSYPTEPTDLVIEFQTA